MQASTAPYTTFPTGVGAKALKTTQEVHGAPPPDGARPQGPVNKWIREKKNRVEESYAIATTHAAGVPQVSDFAKAVFYRGKEVDKGLFKYLGGESETSTQPLPRFWCVVPTTKTDLPPFMTLARSKDYALDEPLRPKIDWPDDYDPIWEEVSPEELEEKWLSKTEIIYQMQTHNSVELPFSLFPAIAKRATEFFSKDDHFWIETVDVSLVMTEVSEPDVVNREADTDGEGSSNHPQAEIDVVDLGSATPSETEADDERSLDCPPLPQNTQRGGSGCSMRAESSDHTSPRLQPFGEHESDSESQNCGNQNKRHLSPDEDCDGTQMGDRKKRRLC